MCQNVLSILHSKHNEYDSNKSFYSWSFKICHYQIKGYFSKKKRNREDSYEFDWVATNVKQKAVKKNLNTELVESLNPAEILSQSEIRQKRQELINNLIKRLPPQQEAWYIYFMEGKSRDEIKEIMNISEFNYYSLRFRTIKRFQQFIKDYNVSS